VAVVKESACQCRRCQFDLWARRIPWRRKMKGAVSRPGQKECPGGNYINSENWQSIDV